MADPPSLGVYDLTVLARIVARCRTLPEVQQAIRDYPEDVHREGRIRDGLAAFVAAFDAYDRLAETVRARVAEHGGSDALDDLQNHMDFDEFMAGWDEPG